MTGLHGQHGPQRNWHAVFCKPNQDARAETHLLNQGFEIFRPKTEVRRLVKGHRKVRIESMFPRYLFVRLHSQGQDWAPIRSTRGVIGLVRLGLETPIVPEVVIDSLRRRCDGNGLVNLTGSIDFRRGESIEIIDGPCAGYRAVFEARTGQERVVVLLQLLLHERRVEIAERNIRRP